MRILLINNLFQPEPNHLKGLAFAKALCQRGHAVSVLTGFPNYPGGKVYPGYRLRWTQREAMDGIPVTRVAMYPSHDRSAARRSLNYLSLGLSMLAHAPGLREPVDVCYVYMGPITLMWPAVFLKWARGARIVADVQDLWPDSVTDSGMLRAGWPMAVIRAMTQWTYRQADRLVVLSEGYRDALAERGLDPARIAVVHNWTDETVLARQAGAPTGGYLDPDRFNIVYAGNMGRLQGLHTVLDAARLLLGQGRHHCRFLLVGDGVDFQSIQDRIRDEGLSNVVLRRRVPADVARRIQVGADVLLLHLARSGLTRIGIPQKLQSYMAAGRPVLAAADGEAAQLVRRARCGVVCPPSDPAALARSVGELEDAGPEDRRAMGERGRAFYVAELSFERGLAKIGELLDGL